MNFFSIDFNDNENHFWALSQRCRNGVAVLDQFDANGISIICFKKHAFAGRVFTLILAYHFNITL